MRESPFTLIYENDELIAVNKASGLLVTPDRFDKTKKALSVMLSDHLHRKVFVVHRIDQETSGLVLFAKNPETHRRLCMAFEDRWIEKYYIAVAHGRPAWTETQCDLSLVPNGNKRHQTTVDTYHGKRSLTHFRLVLTAGNYCVLEAKPFTGRTHQIRVHLASLGYPIVCDPLYGKERGRSEPRAVYLSDFKRGWRGDKEAERPLLNRLGLHASRLVLPAERGGEAPLVLEAPPAHDLAAFLRQAQKANGE